MNRSIQNHHPARPGGAAVEELLRESKNRRGFHGLYQRVWKRVIDLLFCIPVIPAVLLCTIPIAIAIKCEDGGPIFYRSRRIGKDFREFDMLKFRSMRVDAPDLRNADGSTYNSESDDRVTRVGRLLRETSLDELPQCFNVLCGHMSLLGPRAGDVESKDTYREDEADKLLVRPGISGYTQAYFRNSLGVREKRLWDAWYAHNVSFRLDLRIFAKTIVTVLKRDNVYTNPAEAGKNDETAETGETAEIHGAEPDAKETALPQETEEIKQEATVGRQTFQ